MLVSYCQLPDGERKCPADDWWGKQERQISTACGQSISCWLYVNKNRSVLSGNYAIEIALFQKKKKKDNITALPRALCLTFLMSVCS